MTNELIEFYREHLKPIIQTMLLERNYQGQGKVDYEEFGRDFDELLDLAIVGMQSNSDEDCISRQAAIEAFKPRGIAEDVWQECHEYKVLNSLPPVTPKSKTGYWIFDDECREHGHCSLCGYGSVDLMNGEPHDFCRRCGAKMEVEE